MNASDINGMDDQIYLLLQKLPGKLAAKQEFFNNRFHLRCRKTNYTFLWEDLGHGDRLARAKMIFDYGRAHLPKKVLNSLGVATRDGKCRRRIDDPAVADVLFFDNGKPRKIGRLLAEYLPTDSGKTVATPHKKAPTPPSQSELATRVLTKQPTPVKANHTSETTRTSDGEHFGWWRDQKRYESIERLGRGGMALVFKVRDTQTGRIWAAKVIDPNHRKDEEYQARFFREVRAQSQLHHANILRVVAHGRDFYIAELCTGSIADLLGRDAPKRRPALVLFEQACAGVAHAHGRRVLHRDLKPSNLLLRRSGALVVSDFGLCKIDASEFTTLTSTGAAGGTFRYAAPEQWRSLKDATTRSDVFSLGVILQDLLLGRMCIDLPDRPALALAKADAYIAVVERATAYRPEERFDSVRALLAAVTAVGGDAATERRGPSPKKRRR